MKNFRKFLLLLPLFLSALMISLNVRAAGEFDTNFIAATRYSNRTTAETLIQKFGIAGDKPVPNAFIP